MTTNPVLGIPKVNLVDDEDVVREVLTRLLRPRRLLSEGIAPAKALAAVSAVERGALDFVERSSSNNALVHRIEQALRASAESA